MSDISIGYHSFLIGYQLSGVRYHLLSIGLGGSYPILFNRALNEKDFVCECKLCGFVDNNEMIAIKGIVFDSFVS